MEVLRPQNVEAAHICSVCHRYHIRCTQSHVYSEFDQMLMAQTEGAVTLQSAGSWSCYMTTIKTFPDLQYGYRQLMFLIQADVSCHDQSPANGVTEGDVNTPS